MAKPELGAKQLCPNCAAKFYDLTKRPAVCPKCHTAFDPEEVVKIRRVRTRAEKADYDDDDLPAKPAPETVDGFEDEVDDTPEIDQAIEDDVVEVDDEAEGDVAGTPKPAPADDLGVDFAVDDDVVDDEADEDVPFLEDEDEDGFSEDDIVVPGEDE